MNTPNIPEVTLERQAPLRLTIPRSVGIVGVGGVGSWIALFLALAGVKRIYLWDGDTVAENNLNRIPLDPDTVHHPKSQAMAELLHRLRPSCEAIAVMAWTPEAQEEISDLPEWLVVATDTWKSRKLVYDWVNNYNDIHAEGTPDIKYLEAGAEGEIGDITGVPAEFTTDLEDNPGYASVPVWVGPCVTAAYLACAHILHDKQVGREVYSIGWDDGHNQLSLIIPASTLVEERSA